MNFWSVAIKNFCDHTSNTVASELSSLNFNSSVRAERAFAIRYLNVVIKSLWVNLDFCLNCHANIKFQSRNSVRVISVTDHTESQRCYFKSLFSVALLNSLADFATEIHFSH